MPTIPLTRGLRARVDWCDYKEFSKYKWHADAQGYAVRGGPQKNRVREVGVLRMHRIVMGLGPYKDDPIDVDHKNHDVRDNRRSNLRICTRRENFANLKHQSPHGVGVEWMPGNRKRPYRARVTIEGKNIHIGMFATPEEAREARRLFVEERGL